jgi:thiamine-phosphate pyrophosphorylase
MPLEYTPAVVRALESARARAVHAEEVLPLHLLSALCEDDEGRVAVLLTAAGLDLAAARAALPAPGTDGPSPDEVLPLAADTRRVLRAAREPAALLSADQSLPTDAVLIALLRQEDDLRRLLETHGLRFAELEQALFPVAAEPLELDEPADALPAEEPEEVQEPGHRRRETPSVHRILDAAANRAREALRVLEDYSRFALNDRVLSGELKQTRHDLAAVLSGLPAELLASRDTGGDVGTDLSTERERRRESLLDVARAGCKRLQEALRSLEEFGKLQSPELGEAFEQLRYRGYGLEQALILGAESRHRLETVRLMVLVTESLCRRPLEWVVREAAAGGADAIQLREKELSNRDLLERARQVRRWTREEGALFVVNDRPDVAVLAEADAVHLGQGDVRVADARRVVGPRMLIGVSTANLGQLQQAVRDAASYVGVGPAFPSQTKSFAKLAGLGYVREAMMETTLPAFAIGGVNLETVGEAVAAGARRVAVSQAVCGADDPRDAAAQLKRALDAAG